MGLNLQTHKAVKRGGSVVMTATAPYVRLSDGEQVIFIQKGKFWTENPKAPEVKDPPAWAIEQANNLTPKVAAEVGWITPEERKKQEEADASENAQNLSKSSGAKPKPLGAEGGGPDIPENWSTYPASQRKAWAAQISGSEVTTVAEADPIIGEYLAGSVEALEEALGDEDKG